MDAGTQAKFELAVVSQLYTGPITGVTNGLCNGHYANSTTVMCGSYGKLFSPT